MNYINKNNCLRFLPAVLLLVMAIATGSCNKLVEVDTPVDRISGDKAFDNDYNAAAVLTGIYYKMSEGSLSSSVLPALSADELITAGDNELYYTNTLNSNDIGWNYGEIYRCNSAIEGLTNSTRLSDAVKKQLLAEALFVRAFNYFYLTNLYGNVPLALTSDYRINGSLPRTNQVAVYAQIIEDLKAAEQNLSAVFTASDAVSETTERLRPTKWAAAALLARVYLYTGKWEEAEAEATKVIDHTDLFELMPLDQVFKSASKEAIWQLQNIDPNFNTQEANKFILLSPVNFDHPYYLNDSVFNAFENNDGRKTAWVGSFTDTDADPDITYHYPYKYQLITKDPSSSFEEHSIVLRLAELFLIRAEARAQLNLLEGENSAAADVNQVRLRAGLLPLDFTSQQQALLAIEQERRVELFTEWGHRWLDLKRTGRADIIMPSVTQAKGGSWEPTDKLYPVPLSDILKDPNLLPQNDGY